MDPFIFPTSLVLSEASVPLTCQERSCWGSKPTTTHEVALKSTKCLWFLPKEEEEGEEVGRGERGGGEKEEETNLQPRESWWHRPDGGATDQPQRSVTSQVGNRVRDGDLWPTRALARVFGCRTAGSGSACLGRWRPCVKNPERCPGTFRLLQNKQTGSVRCQQWGRFNVKIFILYLVSPGGVFFLYLYMSLSAY